MVEKTHHEPGSFCWVELGTSDAAAAKVTMPPMEIETAGRFALLSDPQGAGFAVIQLKAA